MRPFRRTPPPSRSGSGTRHAGWRRRPRTISRRSIAVKLGALLGQHTAVGDMGQEIMIAEDLADIGVGARQDARYATGIAEARPGAGPPIEQRQQAGVAQELISDTSGSARRSRATALSHVDTAICAAAESQCAPARTAIHRLRTGGPAFRRRKADDLQQRQATSDRGGACVMPRWTPAGSQRVNSTAAVR
jgi:hypothetical protein